MSVREGRCRIGIRDTGVGLRQGSEGLGTGLATLQQRLLLAFGDDVQVSLSALEPRGVCAKLEFPARWSVA